MGIWKNTAFAIASAGLLLAGLVVLVPHSAAAVEVRTGGVELLDRDTGEPNTLRVRLTTTVVVGAGELIPLGYAEIRVVAAGSPAFDGTGRLEGALSCLATIANVAGPSPSFGRFQGYGYQVGTHPSGYGYTFTTPSSVDFSGYTAGYTAGYGYGYGSATAAVVLTVTLTADNCPTSEAFAGNTVAQFTYQAIVGASEDRYFPGLPQTVYLRNPEVPFAAPGAGNTATAAQSTLVPTFQAGRISTLTISPFAGTLGDGLLYVPEGTYPVPLPAGTSGSALSLVVQRPLPEGASLQLSLQDRITEGGAFGLGSAPFNISPAALAAITGGAPPAGFISVQASGLPPGETLSSYINLEISLDVPQAYFTGPPPLSPYTFRLARFNDDGTSNPAANPTCMGPSTSPTPAAFRYVCTLTDFSSFAMVAAFAGGGGGGGGGGNGIVPSPTTPPTTTAPTTTGAPPTTASGTDAPGTQTGDPHAPQPPVKKPWWKVPALGPAALVLALLAVAALAARRRMA